jgi:hypothetical protein
MTQVTYLEQALNNVENLRKELIYKFSDIKDMDLKSINLMRQFKINCNDLMTKKYESEELLPRIIEDYITNVKITTEKLLSLKQADEAVDASIKQINQILGNFRNDLMENGFMNQDGTPTPQADMNIAVSSSFPRIRKPSYPQSTQSHKKSKPRISLKQRSEYMDNDINSNE